MKIVLCLLFFIFTFHFTLAQRINSDLPDQSDGAYVLKPRQFQVEEKLWLSYMERHPNAWISSTLLRMGVVKNLELRLLIEEGKSRDIFMKETTQGLSPLALSAKFALLKERKILPDITLVGYLQLPFTSRSSENAMRWSPSLLLALEKKIKKFKFSFNGGWKENNFDTQNSWSMVYSVRYPIAKKLETFIEYFGQYSIDIHPSHNLDGGIQYYVKNNLQVFVTTGTNIEEEEWKSFVALGCAFRFDP